MVCTVFFPLPNTNPYLDGGYPQQPSSPGYPPRNGPAPFYVVAGGQPLGPQGQQQQQPQQPYPQRDQQQQQQPYPQRDPTPQIPSNTKPVPLQTTSPPPHQYSSPPPQQYNMSSSQTGHRPQSTYSNPQELATPAYDSPVNTAPNNGYSGSIYSQDDGYNPTPVPSQPPPVQQQQQYSAYVPPQQQSSYDYDHPTQQPQQPTHAPPPAPINSGYPVIAPLQPRHPQDARTSLPSQGANAPPQAQYVPYQRPDSAGPTPITPSAPPGQVAPSPADYYRNTAY